MSSRFENDVNRLTLIYQPRAVCASVVRQRGPSFFGSSIWARERVCCVGELGGRESLGVLSHTWVRVSGRPKERLRDTEGRMLGIES